jgi:tetratricopeptide (TPR) repeat protein
LREAEETLTSALKLQDDVLRSHYYLGLLFLIQGKHDDAETHLQLLAKEDFETERVRLFLAISAVQQGKVDQAQLLLQELEPYAPNLYPTYQVLLANLAIPQEDWPKALDLYRSVLDPQTS